MFDAATEKEKLQVYVRKDQVARLHLIRGLDREPISRQVESALDIYFARMDRRNRRAATASDAAN